MTTRFEDDTTGEQYTSTELNREGIVPEGELFQAGVHLCGPFDKLDFHPEHADYDALRDQLHEMVDRAVDAWEPEADNG